MKTVIISISDRFKRSQGRYINNTSFLKYTCRVVALTRARCQSRYSSVRHFLASAIEILLI